MLKNCLLYVILIYQNSTFLGKIFNAPRSILPYKASMMARHLWIKDHNIVTGITTYLRHRFLNLERLSRQRASDKLDRARNRGTIFNVHSFTPGNLSIISMRSPNQNKNVAYPIT
jgi:hypothetical protein